MTAVAITHPAGTARPLLSGGYAVDFGGEFPSIVADRDAARRELDARAAKTPPRSRPGATTHARSKGPTA